MTTVFSLLAAVITIYTILCFIEIIMSWIPGAKFTKFGQTISKITEPYLHVFSRLKWTHVGYVDFSPIISLGILSLASSIFGSVAARGRFLLGNALGEIVRQIWGLCSSLIGLLFILMLIRFIVLLVKKNENTYDTMWYQLDSFLRPIVQAISKPFYRNQNSYKGTLLTTLIVIALVYVLGNILCAVLVGLFNTIPF